MAQQTQRLIRVSYLDRDAGELRFVEVGSRQLDVSIVDSQIIKLTLRDRTDLSIYVNANRISLIEETDSKAKITVNNATSTTVFELEETVSELQTIIDSTSSGSGGGGVWGTITGTLSNQTDLQSALDALTPSTAENVPESDTIDGSVGTVIQMTITTARTFSFQNIEGGSSRVLLISGASDVGFNAAYDINYQSPITLRQGNTRLITVLNYGTTASPLYAIRDTIDDAIVFEAKLTRVGEAASTGFKTYSRMIFPVILTDVIAQASAAPSGADATFDIRKGATSIFSSLVTIDAGDTTSVGSSSPFAFQSDPLRTFSAGDIMNFDVVTIGTNPNEGEGFSLYAIGYLIGG